MKNTLRVKMEEEEPALEPESEPPEPEAPEAPRSPRELAGEAPRSPGDLAGVLEHQAAQQR